MEYVDLINDHPEIFDNSEAPLRIITDPDEISLWNEARKDELRTSGKPLDWAEIGILVDDPYILVLRDLVEFPNGDLKGYIRLINRAGLSRAEAVVILTEMESELLLLRQYRHATRKWHLEIPRGFGEVGLSPQENAKKELYEEVRGVLADGPIDLGVVYNNTGMEGLPVRLFFARLSSVGSPATTEGIDRLLWVRLHEFECLIRDEEITDGFTIAAYTRARLQGLIG